jgi:tripartite ATP-independent transporter DctP family solute receptor
MQAMWPMSDPIRGWWSEISGALLVVALSTSTTALSAREFRAADAQPAEYPTVQAVQLMSRLIEERTGGRHRIRVFHSGQLGNQSDTIEQTRVGAIDINRTTATSLGYEFSSQVGRHPEPQGWIPSVKVLALPFLFRSLEHQHKVLDQGIGDEILVGLERYGFVGLAFYTAGARSIYNRTRPIRVLEDLKGLRIRVPQSELMKSVIGALGADPVVLPYSQVRTALATGLIDGAEHNLASYVSTGHYRLAPYYTFTEHTMGPDVLMMSMRAWKELSIAERKIFRDAARSSSLFLRELWDGVTERSRLEAFSAGATMITKFEREPFRQAMEPVYEKVVTDEQLRQLVERIRAVQ